MNVNLPPIPTDIPKTPTVAGCFICQSQERERLRVKNRTSINRRINYHKLEVHGIPFPQPPQPKKQKIQKIQPPGEGRWIKPVDSQHVEAQWYPTEKSSSSATAWVPSHVPRKFVDESDEDDGLINGFDIA